MRRHRVREETQLRGVRRRRNVEALGMVRSGRLLGRETRRQTPVHRTVDQLRHLGVVELAHLLDPEARLLHRVRHRHRLEVAAVVDRAARDVDQRVVRRRVELDREDRMRANQIRQEGTDPLRRRAERVAVLAQHALVLLDGELDLVVHRKLAAMQERADVPRDLNLTRVWSSDVVDEPDSE